MSKTKPNTTTADDLDAPVWGAKCIAQEIGRNPRVTFYLLEQGLIPAKKIGVQWVSTRRQLRAALAGE
jgi:hypothetical protein